MNQRILYQVKKEICTHFTSFTVWQKLRLEKFVLGVMLAEHCHQSKVARALKGKVKVRSLMRQLQRCIADDKWSMNQFTWYWVRWVLSRLPNQRIELMVDETKIRDKFGIMMVSVAFEKRCVHLACRCYKANSKEHYPPEGQVKMIVGLLAEIKAALPDDREVLVLADRGIGTSPALCRAIETLGWHYLFRVVRTVKIKTERGKLWPFAGIQKGGRWAASGIVFITQGKISAHIRAIWEKDCAEPWILVTNNPELTGREYAMRNWQEQGFRDLKSAGWNLAACRLRSAERLERYMAILMLAHGLALALGSWAAKKGRTSPLIMDKAKGKLRPALSLFQEGLRFFTNNEFGRREKLTLRYYSDPRTL